jgi:hypothetical protein
VRAECGGVARRTVERSEPIKLRSLEQIAPTIAGTSFSHQAMGFARSQPILPLTIKLFHEHQVLPWRALQMIRVHFTECKVAFGSMATVWPDLSWVRSAPDSRRIRGRGMRSDGPEADSLKLFL